MDSNEYLEDKVWFHLKAGNRCLRKMISRRTANKRMGVPQSTI